MKCGRSSASLKRPRWSAVRATLLGKIYEAIVSGYFTQVMNYELIRPAPVYWCDTFGKEPADLTEDDINTIIKGMEAKLIKCHGIDESKRKMVLDRMEKAIRGLKNNRRRRFNPDLVLRKAGRMTVIEIQLWPEWLKRQHRSSELTWNVIKKEGIALFPRVLAKFVRVRGKPERISRFLYISYSRSPGHHDEIKAVFDALCPAEFDILYFVEILKEVRGRAWFLEFLEESMMEVNELFRKLKEGELPW